MGPVELLNDEPQTFSFQTEGPGLITLAWTEPGKAYAVTITDPDNKRIPIRGDRQHAVKDTPLIRTTIMKLIKPGTYRIMMRAASKTRLHLGYAWIPMKEVKHDKIAPQAKRAVQEANNNPPHMLIANTLTRDTDHWVTASRPIPVGHVAHHASPSSIAKRYFFPADGPGILTLAVRGKERADMAIDYNSFALKPKIKGHHDQDHYGDPGAEQTAILIPSPDNIAVEIDPLGSGGSYAFSSSWLSLDGVIAPASTPPAKQP